MTIDERSKERTTPKQKNTATTMTQFPNKKAQFLDVVLSKNGGLTFYKTVVMVVFV